MNNIPNMYTNAHWGDWYRDGHGNKIIFLHALDDGSAFFVTGNEKSYGFSILDPEDVEGPWFDTPADAPTQNLHRVCSSDEENDLTFVNFIYFHGELARHLNCDTCCSDGPLSLGVYPIKVDGYEGDCTAYIWRFTVREIGCRTVYGGRGLIVSNNDPKGLEYAAEMYRKQSDIL